MERTKKYSAEDFKKFIKNISESKSLDDTNAFNLSATKKEKDIDFLKVQFNKKRKDDTVKLL